MELNSCLYEINIWHERRSPKHYAFDHRVFMFYLDLDELSQLPKINPWFGYNQGRVYNFKDDDHILSLGKTAKESVLDYVKSKGLQEKVSKVYFLTNVRTFGYVFNPVSFYFLFNADNKPLCVVPQIGNTFGELKYFYLGQDKLQKTRFMGQQTKYYYISPFTDLDNVLDFKIQVPDERLKILIDVFKDGQKFFFSSMIGKRMEFNSWNLFWETVKFPFVTLKVIFLIHWHAAVLHFIKKIPHHAKEENPQYQQEVYRPWKPR